MAVSIHSMMKPQIKYIAAYRVAPFSAITHIAPVRSIEPWKGAGKFVVNFTEPAHEIGPISLVKGGRAKATEFALYQSRSARKSENLGRSLVRMAPARIAILGSALDSQG